MKITNLCAAFLMLAVAFSSCKRDKLDFEMMDDLAFGPQIEAPLVKARLSLNDVVARDSGQSFGVDPDNAVRIHFIEEDVFSFSIRDFVDIPVQDPVDVPVIVGAPPMDIDMSLGTVGGVALSEAEFEEGSLVLDLNANSALTSAVDVEVSLKNAISGGSQIVHTLTLPAGSTNVQESLDLTGSEWDFSNNGQSSNYIGLRVEVANFSATDAGQNLGLQLHFTDLGVAYAEGDFGQRNVNIPAGSFDFDISGLEDLFDGFYLQDPSIALVTESTVGAALELNTNFKGVNKQGNIVPLNAEAQQIDAAGDVSQASYDTLVFHNQNSDISEFLAAMPREVLYSGSALINPTPPSSPNFISSASAINVGVVVDVPLELSIDNMRLRQQLDVDLFEDNPEQVEELTLIFYTSNGFPLNMDVSVAFLDAAAPHDSLDGFNLGLLQAATVDGQGQIVQRGEPAPQTVTVSDDMLERLKKSNKIRFTAKISTEQDGVNNKIEKFFTNFDLEIKVAAKAKLNINVSDE